MVIDLPTQAFNLANIKNVMEGVTNLFIGADGQLGFNTSNVGWEESYYYG